MATIYDIAAHCGLSPATVSRVLSGKKTSETNREKVLASAKALNYHNLQFADAQDGYVRRPGIFSEQKTILLVPGRNGSDGIYDAARELGYAVELTDATPEGEKHIRAQLSSGAAVGLLLNGGARQEFAEECSQHHPTVLVSTFAAGRGVHSVWIDYASAFRQLLHHLYSGGCRRIWCFTSRIQRDVLLSDPAILAEQERVHCSFEYLDATDTFYSTAFQDHIPMVEKILSVAPDQRPDALILPNSVVASCVVCLLRMRGIRIPEDLAVISLLGGDHDRACEPYLTSVLPPFYELSYEGMRILDNLINGKIVPNNVSYPYQLHYGGSSRADLAPFGEIIE